MIRYELNTDQVNKLNLTQYAQYIQNDGVNFINFSDILNHTNVKVDEFKQDCYLVNLLDLNFELLYEAGKISGYEPTINITTQSIGDKGINSTVKIKIKGSFLDYLNDFNLSASNETGVSLNVISQNFDEIIFEVTLNSEEQTYILTLSREDQIFTFDFEGKDLILIEPSLNGSGQSLWVKGTGVDNGTILTDGQFQAEQNNGQGWNEHAYYGNFTGIINTIEHEFTVGVASNAFCYIRFNNTNNPSTAGNPRIYQVSGNQLRIYSSTGTQIATTTLAVGDIIKVIFTETSMEVLKNSNSVILNVGDYSSSLAGSYVNFTAFRFSTFTDIKTIIL